MFSTTLLSHLLGVWAALMTLLVLGAHALLPHRRSIVLCPKAKLPAAVILDGHLAIEACSRSLNPQGCNQGCLPQLDFSPEEVGDFVAARRCGICRAPLTAADWYASRLAAASPDGRKPAGCGGLLTYDENGQRLCWKCNQEQGA